MSAFDLDALRICGVYDTQITKSVLFHVDSSNSILRGVEDPLHVLRIEKLTPRAGM